MRFLEVSFRGVDGRIVKMTLSGVLCMERCAIEQDNRCLRFQ